MTSIAKIYDFVLKCDIDDNLSFTMKGPNNNGHMKVYVYVFLLLKYFMIATFMFQAVNSSAVLHNFTVVPLPFTCIDKKSVVSSFKLDVCFFFKITFGNVELMKTREKLAANIALYLCKLKDAVEQF